MKKIILMVLLVLWMAPVLKADETSSDNNQDFAQQLDQLKNPFDDGLPKPVIVPPPVYVPPTLKPVYVPPPPKPVPPPIVPPSYHLQGLLVGEGLHEAIIDDKIVALGGSIEGGRLIAVTKQAAVIDYQGKKVLLKVE